jgi:hypothetical protein
LRCGTNEHHIGDEEGVVNGTQSNHTDCDFQLPAKGPRRSSRQVNR